MKATTKTAQFTPGPWIVTEHSAGMVCVAGPDHKDLCAVGYNRTEGRNDVANATLIAAAPAMYEALVETMRVLRSLRDNKEEWYTLVTPELLTAWDKNKAVLAQAEGHQHG